MIHMDKMILEQYIDACELIKETEKEIRDLQKKKKTVVQTNVRGSNPEFPYNPQHFVIQGTTFSYDEDKELREKERILEERKTNAEEIKTQVEEWMNGIPMRMQRIIKYKLFENLTWQQVAEKMGRKYSGETARKQFENFMKEK